MQVQSNKALSWGQHRGQIERGGCWSNFGTMTQQWLLFTANGMDDIICSSSSWPPRLAVAF